MAYWAAKITMEDVTAMRLAALQVCGNEHDAEDAAQDACVWAATCEEEEPAPILAYMCKAAINAAMNIVTRKHSPREVLVADVDDAIGMAVAGADMDSIRSLTIEGTDELEYLKSHIDQLPGRQRDAVWGIVVEGRTVREIGEITGVPKSTVQDDYDAGIAALRESLGDYYRAEYKCQHE